MHVLVLISILYYVFASGARQDIIQHYISGDKWSNTRQGSYEMMGLHLGEFPVDLDPFVNRCIWEI